MMFCLNLRLCTTPPLGNLTMKHSIHSSSDVMDKFHIVLWNTFRKSLDWTFPLSSPLNNLTFTMFAILGTFFGTGIVESGCGVAIHVGGRAFGRISDCNVVLWSLGWGVGIGRLFVIDKGVVERSDLVIGRDEESDEYVEAETDAQHATKRPLTHGWVFQLLPVILKRKEHVEHEDGIRWLCKANRHRYWKHKLSGHNSRAQAQTQGLQQAEERQG